MSLKYSCGHPVGIFPVASSPCKGYFGMRSSFIHVTCPSHHMCLCFKRVYKLGVPAIFQHRIICHIDLPCDSQDTSEAVHVKHIQPFLLVCTRSPRLTSIKQSADYTGFIYNDFGMFCQPVVEPCMSCEPRACRGSLPDLLVELTVDGNVVCDNSPQVHKLTNDL